MKTAKFSVALVLVLAVFGGVQWADTRGASADSEITRPISMIVVDGISARASMPAADLASSFVSLLTTLERDDMYMFMVTDDSDHFVGPYRPTASAFKRVRADFDAVLRWPITIRSDDLATALLETHAAMVAERASEGSRIYLMVGDSPDNDFERLSSSLQPLIGKLTERGWSLNGVSLPGAEPAAKSFLDTYSNATGGRSFDLAASTGLSDVADDTLSRRARGTLVELGARSLEANELMSSVVSVAPGTSETTILIFRDQEQGSFQLSDPTGFAISDERATYRTTETPNAVIWEIQDPTPGNWKVDIRDLETTVSLWSHASNDYGLVLETSGSVPIDQAASMVAYVTEGDRLVKLDDVQVIATITTPEGAKIKIEMLDDGAAGDRAAGDGAYSTLPPPFSSAGEYKVDLELLWFEFNYRLTSSTTFKAEAYPGLVVDSVDIEELKPGERTHVADVLVHIDKAPYSVPQNALAPIVNASSGSQADVEIVPKSLFGDGPAWEYEVFLTVSDPGAYSVAIQLDAEYGGNSFSRLTDALVIRSSAPEAPAAAPVVQQPQPAAAQPAPVAPVVEQQPAAAQPAPVAPSPAARQRQPLSLPWMAIAATLLLTTVGGIGIYSLLQARPYGYIYGDGDAPLVDFSTVKRGLMANLFRKSSVDGKDLGIPGLEGVVFKFAGGGIRVHVNAGERPTVRVNNQPLTDQAVIENRTWIGARGRLYTFMAAPMGEPEMASADD